MMTKKEIIQKVRTSHPEINNLSERTWDEVANALSSLYDSECSPVDAMASIFKSISGQIRHEISEAVNEIAKKSFLLNIYFIFIV